MGAKEKRRRFSREFKVEAVRMGSDRQVEVARGLGIHPEVLHRWMREFRKEPGQSFPGQGNLKE